MTAVCLSNLVFTLQNSGHRCDGLFLLIFTPYNKVVLKVRLVSCFYLRSRQEFSGWEVVLTTKKNLSPGLDICYHVVDGLLLPQFTSPLWRWQFFLSVDKRWHSACFRMHLCFKLCCVCHLLVMLVISGNNRSYPAPGPDRIEDILKIAWASATKTNYSPFH